MPPIQNKKVFNNFLQKRTSKNSVASKCHEPAPAKARTCSERTEPNDSLEDDKEDTTSVADHISNLFSKVTIVSVMSTNRPILSDVRPSSSAIESYASGKVSTDTRSGTLLQTYCRSGIQEGVSQSPKRTKASRR